MRVILDTNVLVSGLAYPDSGPGRILQLWHNGGVDLVLSRYILDEIVRVLPKLPRNRRSADEIRELAETFLLLAEFFEPEPAHNPSLRDPKDQPILALLQKSRANYLITGDKDLLVLADQYPIITPAAFWAMRG